MSYSRAAQLLVQSLIVISFLVLRPAFAEPKFEEFDAWVTANMRAAHVSGVSLAIIDHGQIAYAKTYSTSPGVNVSTDSYFQAADITKLILTIPMLQLMQEGKFTPTTPLKEFDIRSSKNVREFLAIDDHIQPRYMYMRALLPALPSLATIMTTKPVKIENLNYPADRLKSPSKMLRDPQRVMQDILQAATQQPLEDYMKASVLEPLKMTRSKMLMQAPIGLDAERFPNNANAVISQGGMWTTATDLSKFLVAVMDSSKLTNQLYDLSRPGFSLPVDRDRCQMQIPHLQKLTHTSVNNYFIVFPESKQGVVILTNSSKAGKLLASMTEEIAKQYNWPFAPKITDDQDQRGALPYCQESYFSIPPKTTMIANVEKQSAPEVAPEPQVQPKIAAKPALDINPIELKNCEQQVVSHCHSKAGLGYYHCAMNTLVNTPGCNMEQRVLKETGGLPVAVNQYQYLSVLKVIANTAENQAEYFILTNASELVPLTQSVASQRLPVYAMLHHMHPHILLLPVADAFPRQQILDNGNVRLIFPQRLTDGCYDCPAFAHAWIAYDFTPAGKLIGTEMIKVG